MAHLRAGRKCGLALVLGGALAACGGSGAPTHRSTPATGPGAARATTATWAAGITAAQASAGTGIENQGVSPWLAAPAGPAPTAASSSGCAGLHDTGWQASCVEVDTGQAVLTGVVETRSTAGGGPAVWKVSVWRRSGRQEIETLAAGDATTPLWAWARARRASLLGNGQHQLVLGFENEGTGGVLDLDVLDPSGAGLLGSQLSIYKGAAILTPGRILTYHPVYRANDPNCCPTGGADRDTVELQGGQWKVVSSRAVPLPGPDGPGFPDDFGAPGPG